MKEVKRLSMMASETQDETRETRDASAQKLLNSGKELFMQ